MIEVPKNRRLTGDARRELAIGMRAMYDRGSSIRAIAAATGRSYGSVERMLREVGTVMRSRGGARPNRRTGNR